MNHDEVDINRQAMEPVHVESPGADSAGDLAQRQSPTVRKRLPVPPLDEADLIEQFVRGSGPGGQAVNKTNNAVSLIHRPTGIRVQAHTHRSRESNRNQARRVLAERVDYHLNAQQSALRKMWEQERRRKLAKVRKQKRRREKQNLNQTNDKNEQINENESKAESPVVTDDTSQKS
ncbi:hypothetical protein O181_002104 [Austropuccinia psidii MF-1]|uniref:Prokaryotic-type class I peptide chain release factors domain-containing protein n=1 Tax=Austropuccinia psidii MF-1 TaxID=1389203 RepID=A0A9Q3BBQ0_9BASI|nr:hypothetical protein [Austropuccinia psidii MF-1]